MARVGTGIMPAPRLPDGVTREFVELAHGTGVHVFAPEGGGSGAALLWIHGGGMVIGAAVQDHARCADLARDLGIVVVSVEYRLAPEHPYPVPLDDCHRAWEWLLTEAPLLDVDPARIAIGGQSAGGGLAAGLVLRVHDGGGPQPAAQWLFCPMLDDRTAANRELDGVRHFLWDNRANLAGWTAYVGSPGAADVAEYAAPARRTDFAGLPAAWVGAGDIELFYSEDRDYAERMQRAGVDVTLEVVRGGPHAFESLAQKAPVARKYAGRAQAWLAARLGVGART
ncbi:alpha/beta hydrolase [Microbacterium terricola]|uniref:Esterase n=1 Tax=Microbacterium terricola TaxID=344163 RepID=A0ABM8E1X8_9MICO|nr:alpha/beta hydrolase [Microbacterium terricola]UYK40490.1 alpha/beta hydrolase [Microbacterium terricola]BDV31786.1 esterase [Microbacterium terricola]